MLYLGPQRERVETEQREWIGAGALRGVASALGEIGGPIAQPGWNKTTTRQKRVRIGFIKMSGNLRGNEGQSNAIFCPQET